MGELQLPYGGYLRWTYAANTYQWPSSNNTVNLYAVNGRFLAAAANAYTGGQPATEWSYPISYTAPLNDQSVVQGSCVTDSGAAAERCWTFANGQTSGIPVTTDAQRWGTVNGTMTKLTDQMLTYSQDAAGNPFVIQSEQMDATGASGTVYSLMQQAVDAYGNATSVSTWDYSTSAPSGPATRVVNTTYNNSCSSPWTGSTSGACPYVNQFLLSLPLTSSVTAGSATTTLVTNTYDNYTKYGLTSVAAPYEFDTAYGSYILNQPRGNVTTTVTPSGTTNMGYDTTGLMLAADDNNGHAVSVTAASGTNHSAPGTIQPNTGNAGDSNLATALSYSPFLAVTTAVAPNSATATTTYDSIGRVTSTQAPSHTTDGSVAGATTTYSYAFGTTAGGTIANGAYTTTATTNTHWTTAVADGLGRTVTQTSGYGTTSPTTVSTVDTVYGPCACSPGGKMVKTSQPYTSGRDRRMDLIHLRFSGTDAGGDAAGWSEHDEVYLPGELDDGGRPGGQVETIPERCVRKCVECGGTGPAGKSGVDDPAKYAFDLGHGNAGDELHLRCAESFSECVDAARGGDADADVHLRSGDAAVDEHDESGDGDEVAAGEWNDFVYLQRGRDAGHADGPEGSGD